MYIYQNGKLYVQDGDVLIGVEIYTDKIVRIKGTETTKADQYDLCTPYEVRCRFHLSEENPYIFPREDEVKADEPVSDVKKVTRKYTRK